MMYEAVKQKGNPVAYKEFEGDNNNNNNNNKFILI